MARRRKQRRPYTPRQRKLRYLAGKGAWGAAIIAALVALAIADRAGLFGPPRTLDRAKYAGKSFRVVRVVDGDTLDVDCPDGDHDSTRIRLLGVDTPETVKPDTPVEHFGPEATAFVRRTAEGKAVSLQLDPTRTRDTFGRLLAYVLLPGRRNLNLDIVATGHGYADPRFSHPLKRDFAQAQRGARKAGRGLWAEVKEEDLPRYYRGKIKLPGR